MRWLWLGLALAAAPCLAQVQPGEWEFTSTSTSRLFAKPQVLSFKRCIRKEDADDPERWMSDPGQGDCKITPSERSGDTYRWEMTCPSVGMRGRGLARLRGTTMDGESQMTGELKGEKFELNTKVTGRRLGQCKS